MNERIGKNDINGDPIEVGHILRGRNRWTIVITGMDTYEISAVGTRVIPDDHRQPGSMRTLRTELYFDIIGHRDETKHVDIDAPATVADQRRDDIDTGKGLIDAK